MSRQAHFNLSDQEFKDKILACKFDPKEFTHEAHLRLAWINIKDLGIFRAEEEIQNQIQNFVAFVGVEDKYNKTLTIAAIKVVFHFMKKSQSGNFMDFIKEFPQLNTNFKGLISSHYSFDIFNSTRAKLEYIKPDLLQFD